MHWILWIWNFLKFKHLDAIKGYLFDKDSIDNLKKSICYEKVKLYLKDKNQPDKIKDILKKDYKNKELKNIIPIKIKDSKELIK